MKLLYTKGDLVRHKVRTLWFFNVDGHGIPSFTPYAVSTFKDSARVYLCIERLDTWVCLEAEPS